MKESRLSSRQSHDLVYLAASGLSFLGLHVLRFGPFALFVFFLPVLSSCCPI